VAQTKRRRRTKHRGNAAGVVEARGRTGRKPTAVEKGSAGAQAAGSREKRREERYDRPPSWRGAFYRALFAAALLLVLGIVLLLVFGLHLGRLFPVGGYGNGFFGHVHSMFLPALTVAFTISPILIRSLRASLLEVFEADYITTARSKGLPERRVLANHALRNAVISTITVLGVNVGYLVGGTLVIEAVYALPGLGQLMINSINQRDFPVVQAITLAFAVMVVLVYLLTDIAHALLDPRVRFE